MRDAEFEAMLAFDDRHWWYRGRRRAVRAVIDSTQPSAGARLLDAGSGSGRTLDELARYGEVAGIELNPLGVEAAQRRGHANVAEAPVEAIPHPDGSFDLVTCLDVLEHTDDDVASLRELHRVTRPGGALVLTVPAYPRLWSDHDEANHHRRRYTRRMLRGAAAEAGWRVERLTGWNATYLLPAALVRLTRRDRAERPGPTRIGTTPGRSVPGARLDHVARSELELTPPALNALLELPLLAEAALIARGANLPVGLSLLALLRKPH